MKLFKLIPFIAFSFFAAFSYGQSQKVEVITGPGNGIFKLVYKNEVPGKVKITIVDNKNQEIFTETLNKTISFARPYNLSDQPTGAYDFIVEDKDGKTVKRVLYETRHVESTVDVSRIANAPSKYLLSVENNEPDRLVVAIFDADRNLQHEQTLTVNGKFAMVYTLKLIAAPTFEVTGSNGITKHFKFE